jgi:hypothetical protein
MGGLIINSGVVGVYAFGGMGGTAGPIGGAEGGLGGYVGDDGIGAGFEGYAYGPNLSGSPSAGVGGWIYPFGGYGYGPVVSLGPLEGYYDVPNNQTYIGISGGEGWTGGVGAVFNGNPLHVPLAPTAPAAPPPARRPPSRSKHGLTSFGK